MGSGYMWGWWFALALSPWRDTMESAVIESVATPTVTECPGLTRPRLEDRDKPRPAPWGALYIILLASVGLCVGGSRLAAAIGHSALIQYSVALTILGLLAVWVRRSRTVLSSRRAQTRFGQPFSVIHVPFSRK